VRFADKGIRAETVHILRNMLNEEYGAQRKEAKHPKRETGDAAVINGSHTFNAVSLAKAGYLSPWKKKLAELLRI
jgi:hypothetical protein